MNKVAHYLQEHLQGEVLTSSSARRYFSTDASIFTIVPSMVLYPSGESDIRKTARFSWQLAERGRSVPITARGLGGNCTGAAIGPGIVMVMPGHMNRILEFDSKSGVVTVEPGLKFATIQQTLHTHGRFLPAAPSGQQLSTIGGAVATNSGGKCSLKYGNMNNFVKGLRVVLANGEAIETKRMNKRELNKKLGQSNFEGDIYRAIDKLTEENQDLINSMHRNISKNTAGYNLLDVKRKDGSIDLTPLFVGSEGTLGIITEAQLSTELYNPASVMMVAFLDDVRLADTVITALRKLPDRPSAAEVVDENLLEVVYKNNPNLLKGFVDKPFPKLALIIEFDNVSSRVQKKLVKKVQKILKREQVNYIVESNEDEKAKLKKLRQAVSALLSIGEGNTSALPIIDDGIVPPLKFNEYLDGLNALRAKYHLQMGIWGHIADANLHSRPLLDLAEVGDRQKIFRLIDEYYRLVISLGGSTSGEYGDGRLRGPYLMAMYGSKIYELMQQVKKIFDPHNTLNPGVKVNVTIEDLKPILRSSYTLDRLYDHLPTV